MIPFSYLRSNLSFNVQNRDLKTPENDFILRPGATFLNLKRNSNFNVLDCEPQIVSIFVSTLCDKSGSNYGKFKSFYKS